MLVPRYIVFFMTSKVFAQCSCKRRMEFSDTNNELEKEVGGYGHVVVLRDIRVVDDDAVVVLKNLPRGTSPGDYEINMSGGHTTQTSTL
ncbi:hypothetical protein BHM03_00014092 [Ensete ventricosum]|uniref:Uncharacterized protein n=1 Tax=Ensete ventricosum TaxID=4639 RepID=A0A426Z4X5_ENSVE|nr:hypothetical protein B296_00046130 [Ensete ventricosum]RZR72502.1 hypothetical protein BHM03_00014092 [Ensete ventricosum]